MPELSFGNAQVELLKLFRTNLSESDLIDLKDILSKFHAQKGITKADQIWDSKGFTDADVEKWLDKSS